MAADIAASAAVWRKRGAEAFSPERKARLPVQQDDRQMPADEKAELLTGRGFRWPAQCKKPGASRAF